MAITPANRDSLRERAYAMSAQGMGVREIGRRLSINKDTVCRLVREERQRRSHDRDAEEAIRDAVTSIRHLLTDLHQRYDRIEGDGPHATYARVKVAETVRRCCRDLIGLYGVTLPETDPEMISMKRMLAMMETELPAPGGYPEVSEQAVLDQRVADMSLQLADYGLITEATPAASDESCDEPYLTGGWGDDVGASY